MVDATGYQKIHISEEKQNVQTSFQTISSLLVGSFCMRAAKRTDSHRDAVRHCRRSKRSRHSGRGRHRRKRRHPHSRNVTTNDDGQFTVPLLPPGEYTVTFAREGFAQVQVNNVVLNVGDQKSLQSQLKIGDVKGEVVVTPDTALVDTNSTVGTLVDRQFVENVPLNGRSFQSLITLTPGIVVVPAGTANTGGQFSVNGQRASANAFAVDGVSANFAAQPGFSGGVSSGGNLPAMTTFGTTQSLVSVDALEEFQVQTSSYAAEYGRQPGGQISIATRSGTSDFHGSVFNYLRNDVFDASDWFANANRQPKPPMRQNDFGGTFGGPIFLPNIGDGGPLWYNGRDRTFFFFSYEGLRLRLPKFSLTNVPTLCLRGLGSCGAGQSAAPAGIQPILNAFPLPNGRDLGNGLAEFSSSYSDPSSLDATSIRIDHAIDKKLMLFVRYNLAPSESTTRRENINLSGLQFSRLNTQTVTAGVSALLTSRANNDFRFNYSSNAAHTLLAIDDFGGAVPLTRGVLIPIQYDSETAQAVVSLNLPGRTASSIPTLQVTGTDFVTSQRQFNVVDSFSYTLGSHQFKFGVDYRRLSPIFDVNSYNLQTNFTSQGQLQAAIAGNGFVFAVATTRPVFVNFSAYGQDVWKLSRRMTINVGIRWEVNPAPTEVNGLDQPAVTQIENLATMQLAPTGTRAWKTTYNNFAPRIGIAYLLSQEPGRETVLRGGFGVFYDTGNDQSWLNVTGFPYNSSRSISNVGYPLSPSQVAPLPLPVQTGLTTPYPLFTVFDPNLKLPYTLQWNIAVERALGNSQTITASYVGAAGRRLLQRTQLNLSPINPAFTFVNLTRNRATSDYNALQVQFQRRLSKGLQALVSYTWSHALDDDSVSDSFILAQRGNAAFDVRHVFAGALTYDIPVPDDNTVAKAVLGGWSIDTIVRSQSALPLDLRARFGVDPATGSLVSVRPNVIDGVPLYVDDSSVPGGRRINRAAFSIPAIGGFGNLGRNQIRGLGSWQIDLALRREFNLTEKLRLQLRGEAFNVFNHPNFGTVQTNLNSPNFGQATGMLNRQLGGISQLYQIGGPRSFQFALKMIF